jgi:hypothetical protein
VLEDGTVPVPVDWFPSADGDSLVCIFCAGDSEICGWLRSEAWAMWLRTDPRDLRR